MLRFTIAAILLAGSALFTGFSLCGGLAKVADAAEERLTFQRDV